MPSRIKKEILWRKLEQWGKEQVNNYVKYCKGKGERTWIDEQKLKHPTLYKEKSHGSK